MTDATGRLRAMLEARRVEYRADDHGEFRTTSWLANGVQWNFMEFGGKTVLAMNHGWGNATPEQAIAATLGSDREKAYDAGFENGVKATLQQLDGLLMHTDSAVEIQAWVDEQWGDES